MSDSIENMMMRCIERFMAGRFTERHALVTSYDPEKHLAKVKFMPEGQESGWLPIETGHIGDGYGFATGLTPGNGGDPQSGGATGGGTNGGGGGGASGQGQQEQGATGDQVIVRYQEGDFEGGKIVQRVHSSKDKPPRVEAGESVMWTKSGQQVFFKKDGSLVHVDGKGASHRLDGGGAIVGRHEKDEQSYAVDDHHTHIKFNGGEIWVDGGCWSSKPIQIKACKDNFKSGGDGAKAGGGDSSAGQAGGGSGGQ